MRNHTACRWLLTAVALIFSAGAAAQVRISEIHYDNVGVDTGEAIEIEGPAGTDLTAYTLVLYNGSNGAVVQRRDPDRHAAGDLRFARRVGRQLSAGRHSERFARRHRAGRHVRHGGRIHLLRRRRHSQPPVLRSATFPPTSSRRKAAPRRLALRCSGMPPAHGRLALRVSVPAIRRCRPRWSRASRSHRRVLRLPSVEPSR